MAREDEKMKVIVTLNDGSEETHEAKDSYHAHWIMYGAFSIDRDNDKHAIRAECPEVDAKFYLSKGKVVFCATDMEWVNEYNYGNRSSEAN